MKENKCRMCSEPESAHRIIFWDGVAHTVSQNANGRIVHCSQYYADRDHFYGQIQALTTIVRSLRNRAGRLRNTGEQWQPDDLVSYSDKLANDIERLQRILNEYPR